jgi:transposase
MPGKHKNRKSYVSPSRVPGQKLTERERTEILTLFNRAGWGKRQIARELRLSIITVCRCILSSVFTPQKQIGRRPILTTQKRRRLIKRATLNAEHRRKTLQEIAYLEGIQACNRALYKAFEREGFFRRKATAKPLLTDKHKADRLAWAWKHINWDFLMWKRVVWTDESSFTTGDFGSIYVTRRAEEKYNPACCIPKFRGYSSWMIHGSISGSKKGRLVVFEKQWGKVTAAVYTQYILPSIYQFYQEVMAEVGFMRAILMEDNASVHSAKLTQSYHTYHGVIQMTWPANSPDLNPIENVWRLLKYRVGRRFPKTEEEVRRFIEEEWAKLTVEDFDKYIKEMPARCQAVIDANGGHTKW